MKRSKYGLTVCIDGLHAVPVGVWANDTDLPVDQLAEIGHGAALDIPLCVNINPDCAVIHLEILSGFHNPIEGVAV